MIPLQLPRPLGDVSRTRPLGSPRATAGPSPSSWNQPQLGCTNVIASCRPSACGPLSDSAFGDMFDKLGYEACAAGPATWTLWIGSGSSLSAAIGGSSGEAQRGSRGLGRRGQFCYFKPGGLLPFRRRRGPGAAVRWPRELHQGDVMHAPGSVKTFLHLGHRALVESLFRPPFLLIDRKSLEAGLGSVVDQLHPDPSDRQVAGQKSQSCSPSPSECTMSAALRQSFSRSNRVAFIVHSTLSTLKSRSCEQIAIVVQGASVFQGQLPLFAASGSLPIPPRRPPLPATAARKST